MKIIAYILSIFILTLTLKPCSDGFNEHVEVDKTELNHDHSKDKDDSCPSTCICDCCGASITYEEIKQFKINTTSKISTKVEIMYQSKYIFDFFSNIWQPPQFIS